MVQQEKEVLMIVGDVKQSTPFGSLDISNAFSSYDFNSMRKILANLKDDCRLGYKDILQEFMNYLDNEVVVKR